MLIYYIEYVFLIIINFAPLIICIAFYTIAERKVLASIQRRLGPNVVGVWGLLQPIADGVKLIFKEIILPSKANFFLFIFAPILTLTLTLFSWSLIPFSPTSVFFDSQFSLLILFALSSLNVYGIILAGWSSNSKYSFLGALRSTAQMISYEVSLLLSVLPIIICSHSFNLIQIVHTQKIIWFVYPFLPLALIFIISSIAETNRTPFDLPEAEAELVAGFNVEYSSITFALFFLAEYGNMILMSSLITILFFGGWLMPGGNVSILIFVIKLIFFCFLFILIRGNLPRYRYDQLMSIGWKIFLPITTTYLMVVVSFLFYYKSVPESLNLFSLYQFFYYFG